MTGIPTMASLAHVFAEAGRAVAALHVALNQGNIHIHLFPADFDRQIETWVAEVSRPLISFISGETAGPAS